MFEDNTIRLIAIYTGIQKHSEYGKGYIIYPYFNCWNEIVLPIPRRNNKVYNSYEDFLQDWTDLEPYENCQRAFEFIRRIKKV